MWWKRKHKNKRSGRSHVLDVKLSTRQLRAARFRFVVWLVTLLFGTVLSLYGIWRGGEWVLARLLYENDIFRIRKVQIETDGVLSIDRIRRWSGVKERDNLVALDLNRTQRILEMVPLIKSVSIQKDFPETIRIKVRERFPVAQVYIPFQPRPTGEGFESAVYYLDESGFVIPPLDAGPGKSGLQPDLPLLTGVNPVDIHPGRCVETGQILAAIKLILAFDRSAMAGWVDLQSLDVSKPETVEIMTDQQSTIVFSVYQIEDQLKRWRAIHEFGMQRGLTLASLDVSIANNLPALWFDKETAPPPKPLKQKPSLKRKRHV